ncbi:5-aminolevulinate synthase [Xylariales sp. PMI_506]|nr:5-aminolevulinate synthase [Xylariales sp. PMI_506]
MLPQQILAEWVELQKPKAPAMRDAPAFYRNLEQALDVRRANQALLTAKPRWDDSVIDFASSDTLSLSRSGLIRDAFLSELNSQLDFRMGANGSRVQYGNYPYILEAEREIAEFHSAETAFIVHSCLVANLAVLCAVPLAGDAIVFDELVHASLHDGMALSLAAHKLQFRHNDPNSLREVLARLRESQPAFKAGSRSVLVCVESVYSMDGDVCPLAAIVQVVKDIFPLGNAQILIDEAHSAGLIGPNGAGLVSLLGLEKEIAIRIHSCGKALATTGGVILANNTIRSALLNHGRPLIYSGAPSLPMVACIRAGFKLLTSREAQEGREKIQCLVKHFFKTITANDIWEEVTDERILTIPALDDWESKPFVTNIVPVLTRPRYEAFLSFHLGLLANISAFAISSPVVPKGTNRVRLMFHAHNTIEQVDILVAAICEWAREMLDIEQGVTEDTIPQATRQVYALQSPT